MSFCQTCGSSLPEGVVACPACGATQGAAPTAATPGPYSAPMPGYVPVAAPMPVAGAGLTPNTAGALAYFMGLITGVIFLVLDPFKNDRFVRFHAFQSIFFNLAWIAFWIIWSIVGVMLHTILHGLFFLIAVPVDLLISLGGLCLWLYLMYAAYQGKSVQLPIIGPLAAQQAGTPSGIGQRL